MKERPILFSAPMVRAILEGRKTMTRRAIREFPMTGYRWGGWIVENGTKSDTGKATIVPEGNMPYMAQGQIKARCPYGQPGDRLWVRETWAYDQLHQGIFYKAGSPGTGNTWITGTAPEGEKVRPSIFMPRWASRILLEVAAVRIERVQDIDEEDAEREGMSDEYIREALPPSECFRKPTAREAFRELWDSINAKRGYGWDANPWVWVIEFRKVAP